MDKEEETSKIFETTNYTWIINDFCKLCRECIEGKCRESPLFPETSAGRKYNWRLRFYPRSNTNSNYVSLFLVPASPRECLAKYTFALKNSEDGLIQNPKEGHCTFVEGDRGMGFVCLTSRKKIRSSLQEDNVLKISVSVLVEVLALQSHHMPDIQENKIPAQKLSRELKTMCNNDKFSDFIFKFEDGGEVKVHRCILATRSKVFSTMFERHTLENSNGCAEITDIERGTMVALLNFIYTGVLVDWSFDKAKKLAYAANKYQLDDLKRHCENILTGNLNFFNTFEILQFADRHNMSELKNETSEYIIETKNFSHPNEFHPLESSNPRLIMELFLKCKIKIK